MMGNSYKASTGTVHRSQEQFVYIALVLFGGFVGRRRRRRRRR